MARYYLDLHEHGEVAEDEDGVEFADLNAARALALRSAREVMSNDVQEGRLCLGCSIEVRDDAGAVVLRVPFKDAIALSGL